MRRYLLTSVVGLMVLFAGLGVESRAGEHTVVLQEGAVVFDGVYAGVRDTWMRNTANQEGDNYGRQAMFRTGVEDEDRGLIRFKIFASEGGPVPDGVTVTSATLSLYRTNSNNGNTLELYRVIKPWVEEEATCLEAASGDAWNVKGCDGSGTDRSAAAVASGDCGYDIGWVSVDVTASVQDFAGSTANEGWLLVNNKTYKRDWVSRDELVNTELRPKLEITYTGNTDPVAKAYALPAKGIAPFTVTFDASASTDVDGTIVSYSWSFGDGSDPAEGARVEHEYSVVDTYTATLTITDDSGGVDTMDFQITAYEVNEAYNETLQDGLDGYTGTTDSYMYGGGEGNNNYGSSVELRSDSNLRIVTRFSIFDDEGGSVPRGVEIVSATMYLYKTSSADSDWEVHELLKNFVESEVTWNDASVTESWSEGGAAGDGTDRASEVVAKPWINSDAGEWLLIDLTGTVQNFSNGTDNLGWVLHDMNNGNNRIFTSRENGTQTLNPKLVITYRCPPTAVIATDPDPAKGLAPFCAGHG